MPKPKRRHVLKIKKVPAEVQNFVADYPEALPEPVAVLVEEIKKGTVEEIVFTTPEPTAWQRLVTWFTGE